MRPPFRDLRRRSLVSTKQRARQSPDGQARKAAGGMSLLAVAMVLFAASPLVLPGGSIQAGSLSLAIVSILASGLVWWWAARVARQQNDAGKRVDQLQAMSPDAFEEWAAARLRERGYTVAVVGTQGDHGIDLVASKVNEQAVVQCKN